MSFSPNRGKVEKNVSSTLFIFSLAFKELFAMRRTSGVSFSGVKIKLIIIAIPAINTNKAEVRDIALMRNAFWVFVFIILVCLLMRAKLSCTSV